MRGAPRAAHATRLAARQLRGSRYRGDAAGSSFTIVTVGSELAVAPGPALGLRQRSEPPHAREPGTGPGRHVVSSGAIVSPRSRSCSQYSSACSRSPDHTIAWPVRVDPVREPHALRRSRRPGGRTRARTPRPSNVLWSSFRTMTRHARPRRAPVAAVEPLLRRRESAHGRQGSVIAVAAIAFDVEAVRARFSALRAADWRSSTGPAGRRCPDSVIDAISRVPARVEREPRRPVRQRAAAPTRSSPRRG